jgi:hypothetical protein
VNYWQSKAERNRALLESLGLVQSEEPTEPEGGPPDFDGGVREPAPSQSNPVQDHDEWVVNLLQEHRGGGVIDFWPMAPKSPPAADPGEDSDQGEDWRKGGT